MFDNYRDSNDNVLSGIEIQNQSSIDVYRTHRYTDKTNGVDYFKYVEYVINNNKVEEIEANYFGDEYSYFMTKRFTPIKVEDGVEIIDVDEEFPRMV